MCLSNTTACLQISLLVAGITVWLLQELIQQEGRDRECNVMLHAAERDDPPRQSWHRDSADGPPIMQEAHVPYVEIASYIMYL